MVLFQVVLTVSQMMWCHNVTEILDGDFDRLEAMKEFEQRSFTDLNQLASIVRGDLDKLSRAILCALITVDVHARDMVTDMVKLKVCPVSTASLVSSSMTLTSDLSVIQVDSVTNFEWQRQLRYYWDYDLDNCVVRMSNSLYVYGYEYLGASPRLVITPLTVRSLHFELHSSFNDITCAPSVRCFTGSLLLVLDGSSAVGFGRCPSWTSWYWKNRNHKRSGQVPCQAVRGLQLLRWSGLQGE